MKLQNYIYITNNTTKEFVTWVKGPKDGLQTLAKMFPQITQQERTMVRYILTLIFKAQKNPQDVEGPVGYYCEGMTVEHTYDFDGRDPKILAIVTPNAYKGYSAVLGTLKIGDQVLTMMRRSEDQALSIEVYSHLIRDDIESKEETGEIRLWRDQCARSLNKPFSSVCYLFIDGEKKCRIDDISISTLKEAGADLDETAEEILDQMMQLRLLVPHNKATVPMAHIWYTPYNGEVFVGKYPVTYGKYQGNFLHFGMMYSNFFADIPGKVLQFVSKGKTYEVVCEEC